MTPSIERVAVIGGGTMGSGIAAACAAAGRRVLLLDVDRASAERAVARMTEGRPPALDDPRDAERVEAGSVRNDLDRLRECDWVCEAAPEEIGLKRGLFAEIAEHLKPDAVVSTNTSGIPLRAILEGMPDHLRRRTCVTHFFNPVRVMKLVELVPGEETEPEAVDRLEGFCGDTLGKGVVRARDTVNFIANRIGCFFMLSGLHAGEAAIRGGLEMETIDALMDGPVGLPATGLYGLIDLIGLDVMDLVGRNLAANLPERDPGRTVASFPRPVQAMLERGQLGRKSGGGFYRMTKTADGGRLKEVYDAQTEDWRPAAPEVALAPEHREAGSLLFADDEAGRLAWRLMGGTLAYAAELAPDIAHDIPNIDRAMRWGFGWATGPFELLDRIGPERVTARLEAEGHRAPRTLALVREAGGGTFYRDGGRACLGFDGVYHAVEGETKA